MSTTARHLRGSVIRGGRVGSVNNLSQRIVLTSACQGELEQRPKSKKTGQPEEGKIVQTPQKEGQIDTYFVFGEKLKWRCAHQNWEWDLFSHKRSRDLFAPSLYAGVPPIDQLGVEKCRKGKHLWEVWALRPDDIFTLHKIIDDIKSQNAANLKILPLDNHAHVEVDNLVIKPVQPL